MVVYKCKICGGTLSPNPDGQTGKCEYCKSILTLPKDKDEKLQNILNRANDFRMFCDFDRAIYEYEKALEIAEDEPEAHWGLMLSRYGVEYVKDPQSFTFKPTLHRISSISVMEDPDYLAAVKYAVPGNAYTYRNEAQVIETTMRRLLQLSASEDPYDIFISYKKEENGVRTADSYFAHDLYNKLTGAGYKVFFAQETLKQAAGEEFEPKIYAAIISAKVMIVIGTKEEYFNAVWVKNEWSRFSELIEHGEDKTIIPVFDGFNASQLPNRLSKYQALQKSDLDFLNVLMQTIEKRVDSRKSKITFDKDIRTENVALERGFLALEDGQFSNAEVFFEKALDANPHSSEAYFGKLMVELKARKQDDVILSDKPLNTYSNFEKAVRFADQQQKISLLQYEEKVQNQLDEQAYEKGLKKQNEDSISSLNEAVLIFSNIRGYKDSEARINQCQEHLEEHKRISEQKRLEEERITQEKRLEEERKSLEKRLEEERIAQKKRIEAEKTQRRRERIKASLILVIFVGISCFFGITKIVIPGQEKAAFIEEYGQEVYDRFGVAEVGNTIKYADIDWLVIDADGNNRLLISKSIITQLCYDKEESIVDYVRSTTWEDCKVRAYLNDTWYNETFSDEEKMYIQITTVINSDKNIWGVNGGNNTKDKVFLLSMDEAYEYFSSNFARKAKCNGKRTDWWLRTPGESSEKIAYVGRNGKIQYYGRRADDYYYSGSGTNGVRPAMWINLGS